MRPFPRLVCFLVACGLLSGCGNQPAPTEKVLEPPYVPAPPVAAKPAQGDESVPEGIHVYADLLELNDGSRRHPRLYEAVSRAIRLGVLKPGRLDERFEPERPLSYREFRQWALAYQSLQAQTMSPNEPKQLNPETPARKLEKLSTPMSVQKLSLLPERMVWDNAAIDESRTVDRETLCALAVYLGGQEAQARALTREDIEATTPGGDKQNTEEALSQFRDYASISPWARRYVALAYRDRLLQKTFRKTVNDLTVDEGFSPNKPVSREEGIVLLDRVFANLPAYPKRAQVHVPDAPAKPKAPTDMTLPNPIGHQESVTESGPSGTRSFTSVSGPD